MSEPIFSQSQCTQEGKDGHKDKARVPDNDLQNIFVSMLRQMTDDYHDFAVALHLRHDTANEAEKALITERRKILDDQYGNVSFFICISALYSERNGIPQFQKLAERAIGSFETYIIFHGLIFECAIFKRFTSEKDTNSWFIRKQEIDDVMM